MTEHTIQIAPAEPDFAEPAPTGSAPASTEAEAIPPVHFDTRIAVMLRDDLLPWQELNVTAFLMSGIASSEEDLVGEVYRDANGVEYLPMFRQPVLVFSADADRLAAAREKSVERGIATAVYTRELFATGHDAANRAAVAAVPSAELDLVGLAVRGPRTAVNRVTKGAARHA